MSGQGRKEAGPGSLPDKPRRPRTGKPEIGPYPIPTQPLRGLLLQSRVHAQATAFRSRCLCCCRCRHPAAVTTRRRRPGHPSGGAGRGRGQRRSQRAGGKRTCSSPRPVPDLLLAGVPTGGQAIRECLVACSSLLGHTQCPLANITCAFDAHHVWDASLNELGSRAHWRRSVQ